MEDLLKTAIDFGYQIPRNKIQPDGSLKRFPVGKSRDAGWIVTHSNTDESIVSVFGDWVTGKKYLFHTGQKPSAKQMRDTKKQIAMARLKNEQDREINAEAAAKEADQLFGLGFKDDSHPYLLKKQLPCVGAKVSGDILMVPMKIGNKLWGIQRIYSDGSKFFLKGQKSAGCYFTIGDVEPFYLCEGYATGVTVHLATGKAVIVAFSAKNMADVAQQFIGYDVTVCADNDRFNGKNTGRDAGIEAAKILRTKVIIPVFPDGNTGTDFNDFFIDFGLDATKRELSHG